MTYELIKKSFLELSDESLIALHNKISNKCSEYYFLDFLKTTNGNIDDAYLLFLFDERLRCLLMKYVLRFEIQIKNDFVNVLLKNTNDNYFWSKKENYIFKDDKEFNNFINKIEEAFKNLRVSSSTANSYEAAYVMSFGTFVSFYKNIKPSLKHEFIDAYTDFLPVHSFDVLHKYLLCLRSLRNRCAHGTHIVSQSFVNQLGQYNALTNEKNAIGKMNSYSVFELTLYYMKKKLNCRNEFSKELKKLLMLNEQVYSKYGGKQSINPTIIIKLFKKH